MKLLTPYAAAIKLKVHEGTLRNWRHQNRGPAYVKFEGVILYDVKDLQAYADEHKIQTSESITIQGA